MLDTGQLAEHRVAADVQPRVVDAVQPVLDLVTGFGGASAVAGRDRGPGGEERVGRLIPGPIEPVVELPAARRQLERVLPLAVMRHDVGEVVATARLEVGVGARVGQLAGGGDVAAGRLEMARRRLDPAREQQRAGAVPDRRRGARGSERGQDPLRAAAVAEDDPGPAEPVDDVERALRLVRGAPGQCGVDVGALRAGEGQVLGLAGAAHALGRRRGGGGEPGGVRVAGAVGQLRVRQRFERERADAVEQPVARRRRIAVVDDHERTARQAPDHVDRRRRGHGERVEHRLDRRQGRAARERGQRPQAALVVGKEQLVAPRDRGLEGSAALRLAAGRVAQHAEAIVEPPRDLLDRQRLGARRGELDRERQAVERAAQLVHLARVPGPGGATREQLHGVAERQRRELEHGLAVDLERDLAGAEEPEPGGRVEQALRQRRGRVDDVLAVVEDHHRPGRLQPLEQGGLAAADGQRADHGVEDVVGGLGGLEPDQPDGPGQRTAGGDRDGRLADAAGPEDLDEPRAAQQLGQGGDLLAAPDELTRQRRQVPGRRGTIEELEGRVVVEHLSLELRQPRSGFETELVREPVPDPLVGRQRIDLAARAVQRRDQQRPQPLLVGVRGHGGFQLVDRRVPEAHLRRELGLDQRRARLLDPCPVRGGPVAGRRQHRAAVERQRGCAQLRCAALVAGLQPPGRGGGVAEHAQRVDGVRFDREPVAAVGSGDQGRIPAAPGAVSRPSTEACCGG